MTRAAPEEPGTSGDPFSSLKSLILAAAGAVGVVFSLFGSVLQSLVPPLEESGTTLGWISLTLLVLLLVLSTLFRLVRRNRTILISITISALFAAAALPTFIYYAGDLRKHVYEIQPPHVKANKRYIRGEIHAEGMRRLGGRSVDAYASDDLDGVQTTEVLWTRESQARNSSRLQAEYVLLVLMLTASLFTAGLAFLATSNRRKRSATKTVGKAEPPH
jgi:lysylphosphatidylglycerol synthetase-like protein (DUF2156 family)